MKDYLFGDFKESQRKILYSTYEMFRSKGYDEETAVKKAIKRYKTNNRILSAFAFIVLFFIIGPFFIGDDEDKVDNQATQIVEATTKTSSDSKSFAKSGNTLEILENFYKNNDFDLLYEKEPYNKNMEKVDYQKNYHTKFFMKESNIASENLNLEYFSDITYLKNSLYNFNINIQNLSNTDDTVKLNKLLTKDLEQIKDIFSQTDYKFIVKNMNQVFSDYKKGKIINNKSNNENLIVEFILKENDIDLKISKEN